jgi:hypothetical protein
LGERGGQLRTGERRAQRRNEELGEPDVITIEQLVGKNAELAWMTEQKHKRVVPHRLRDSGYSVFRKPKTKSGLWQFGNRRLRLYAR